MVFCACVQVAHIICILSLAWTYVQASPILLMHDQAGWWVLLCLAASDSLTTGRPPVVLHTFHLSNFFQGTCWPTWRRWWHSVLTTGQMMDGWLGIWRLSTIKPSTATKTSKIVSITSTSQVSWLLGANTTTPSSLQWSRRITKILMVMKGILWTFPQAKPFTPEASPCLGMKRRRNLLPLQPLRLLPLPPLRLPRATAMARDRMPLAGWGGRCRLNEYIAMQTPVPARSYMQFEPPEPRSKLESNRMNIVYDVVYDVVCDLVVCDVVCKNRDVRYAGQNIRCRTSTSGFLPTYDVVRQTYDIV